MTAGPASTLAAPTLETAATQALSLMDLQPRDVAGWSDGTLRLARAAVEALLLNPGLDFCPRQAGLVLREAARRWPDAPFATHGAPGALCRALQRWAVREAESGQQLDDALRLLAPALTAVRELHSGAHQDLARAIAGVRADRGWARPTRT
jgi:hypothetical protein